MRNRKKKTKTKRNWIKPKLNNFLSKEKGVKKNKHYSRK